MVDPSGLNDGLGTASSILSKVSVWFSNTVSSITLWVGNISLYEWIFVLFFIILLFIVLFLRKKIKDRVRPKHYFN